METFSALWWMVGLAFFLVAPLTLWLPFYMAAKARGIERALWAIVSQLRAVRLEQQHDIDPAATRRARDVAETSGNVKMSMFGR